MTEFLTLQNDTLTAQISPWGASLARLWLAGHDTSLVLGLPSAGDYRHAPDYSGCIVGPIAGRVSGAQTTIDGRIWQMDPNTPPDCLHSGPTGTSHQKWHVQAHTDTALTLALTLAHGACGLPGTRTFTATYSLHDSDLTISIETTTDATTPVNATLHAYWSLDTHADLSTHRLQVNSTTMCATGPDLIPTGAFLDVSGQDHDFTSEKSPIGGLPLDGCFCLSGTSPDHLTDVMSLRSTTTDIAVQVATNQPGLVLYTGENLTPSEPPLNTPRSAPYSAIAIEAQGWPDAVNNPNFPEILVKKGAQKRQITRFHIVAP